MKKKILYLIIALLLPLATFAQSSLTPYQRRSNQIILKYYKILAQGSGDRRFALLGYNSSDVAKAGFNLAYMEYAYKHGTAAAKRLVNAANAELRAAEKLKNSADRLREFYETDKGMVYKTVKDKFALWMQKGEFEKQADFEERLRGSTKTKFGEICEDAFNDITDVLLHGSKDNSEDEKIKLEKQLDTYDSENEQFTMYCTSHGAYTAVVKLHIPISEAQDFKETFEANDIFIDKIKDGVFVGNIFVPTVLVISRIGHDKLYLVKADGIIDLNTEARVDSNKMEKFTVPFDKLNIDCDALKGYVYHHQAISNDNTIYDYNDSYVEEKPSYPGGEEAFYKIWNDVVYLTDSDMTYNEDVHIILTIEKDGTISDVKAYSDTQRLIPLALKVLKSMPKWNPGKNSELDPLRVKYDFYASAEYK